MEIRKTIYLQSTTKNLRTLFWNCFVLIMTTVGQLPFPLQTFFERSNLNKNECKFVKNDAFLSNFANIFSPKKLIVQINYEIFPIKAKKSNCSTRWPIQLNLTNKISWSNFTIFVIFCNIGQISPYLSPNSD